MPIVDGPTMSQSRPSVYGTVEQAMDRLESEKKDLLTAGWVEIDFDPINDPD